MKLITKKTNRYGRLHILEFNPQKENLLFLSVGYKHRERLSKIKHQWALDRGYELAASFNGAYFSMNKATSDTLGLDYRDHGFIHGYTSKDDTTMEAVWDGQTLTIGDYIDTDVVGSPTIHWAQSLSYSLVLDGKKDIRKRDGNYWGKHPRTLLGQRKDGTIVVVVTDGRPAGLTGSQSADLMLELGCYNAINCDGGGSSEMTFKGKIVNRLSGGYERKIAQAFQVYSKPSPKTPSKKCVCLDIGHGSDTWEKTGGKGIRLKDGSSWEEHDFNSKVGISLKKKLEKAGFEVYLSQQPNSTEIPLYKRVDDINGRNIDLVISLHANAGEVGAKGYEVWKWHGDTTKGGVFAAKWIKNAKEFVPDLINRGVKNCRPGERTNFYIVRKTTMPCILIEHFFFTDNAERKKCDTTKYVDKFTEISLKTACEYFGVPYTSQLSPTPVVETERDKAIKWAKTKGISDGKNLSNNITKEELIISLYKITNH